MGWVASGFGRGRGSTFDCFYKWSGEVSSLIDASEMLGHEAQNGECEQGIIHFDATQRRKEKMRQKSQDSPRSPEQQTKPVAVSPAIPTPSVSATKSAPSEPLKKPATNGAATLAGYTTPTTKPSVQSAAPS